MLTELCQELHNWFVLEKHSGSFEITGGEITASFLVPGQYYRIMGSIFNDGVHQCGEEAEGELKDESWSGAVWALAIPQAVINLAAEIAEWQTKYGAVDSPAMSPFNSESFGGYSYSKSGGTSGGTSGSGGSGWQDVFKRRLNAWRKL